MYNGPIKNKIAFSILMLFFCMGNSALCFDLADEISAAFQKFYKDGYSESYLETPYSSVYSKDPFKESIEDIENMSMQVKIAGAEYVENLLKEEGCSLSQKKIWAILYYFVPDFKTDLVRTMKVGLGDYNSRNYVFGEDEILKYCNEYFICSESKGMTISEIWNKRSDFVTSDTSANIRTNCREFFQKNYAVGQDAQGKKQNLQISHLGTDKYRNSTIDDSPYDIMTDLGNIGKLLYTDAERPITPVFYNLPMFSNSKDLLEDHKENDGSSYAKNNWNEGNIGLNEGNIGGSSINPLPLPLPRGSEGPSLEGGIDTMADGLQSYRFKGNTSFGNACDENEGNSGDDVEGEELTDSTSPATMKLSDIPSEEFEEVVDYMKGAVDKYASLSEEQKAEMAAKAGDTSRFVGDVTPSQLDKTAEDIKDCWQSCEGLRIDQKASCMIMCACGEITSADDTIFGKKNKLKLFDPNEMPGLGPILMVRYCAVPAVDTKFSIGGRKMYSIEEGVREIYGVVDKLSREGRLGMWTQQYNFLDSTTKKMNVADTVAFTINIEFEDISDKFAKHSEQFEKMEIKKENGDLLTFFGIRNSLENPVRKNKYRLMGKEGEGTDDITTQGNPQGTKQAQSNLLFSSSSVVDPNSDSRADHDFNKSQLLDKWLDQQGNLWVIIDGYVKALTEDTIGLDSKKDKR